MWLYKMLHISSPKANYQTQINKYDNDHYRSKHVDFSEAMNFYN